MRLQSDSLEQQDTNMPGNELEVCRFLLANRGHIELNHIGRVESIAAPMVESDSIEERLRQRYLVLGFLEELSLISTSHAGKKADVYLNGRGVSIKQSGGSFAFNRLQRANLLEVYTSLGLGNPERIIDQIDQKVVQFHQGLLPSRNQPWQNFFSEADFKTLMSFLMLKGSPNLGISNHPAEFILEATQRVSSGDDLALYSFDEYFDRYKLKFEVAIRRQWIGQESDSEHRRAVTIARKPDNFPWVFDDIVGQPNPHKETQRRWREEIPVSDRKTVYFLMIEKKK
jgi:hypothetical protein